MPVEDNRPINGVSIGERIEEAREIAGFRTQVAAAAEGVRLIQIGVLDAERYDSFSPQWLSRLESDKTGRIVDSARKRQVRTLEYVVKLDLGMGGVHVESETYTKTSGDTLTSTTASRIGTPGKPVRNLNRAGLPILPHEEIVNRFPIPARHDEPGLELYSYEGARLTIGTSHVEPGDIIAMMPNEIDLENGKVYVIKTKHETLVARCAKTGSTTLFVTDDPTRDAILETQAHTLGRVVKHWNFHED